MVSKNVLELVEEKYDQALKNGNLIFTETSIDKLKDGETGMKYHVRYTPSLNKKPVSGEGESEGKKNPFENPEKELIVLDDVNGDSKFRFLLNKYPVVKNHTLLVTSEFQSQNSALSPSELITAYRLINRMDDEDEGRRNMMFYNSGSLSGSSQDHKHLQFIPLPSNFITLQDSLCSGKSHYLPTSREEPLQNEKVSFAHFTVPLPESSDDVDEDLLAMCYFSLLQRSFTFFQDWAAEKPELQGNTSYNLLMTKRWMCIVPRSSTTSKSLSLNFNATAYAGLILVKDQEVLDKIKGDAHILDTALLECGFPSTAGQKTNEYDY
ncbi:hypothetical protein Kpol_2002p19 [Vanderwaltozyma polyspora DSM 70294]|uniref:Uncharacterized protein n=1 Tax=Vanderwaltozyma polyspora (strain ATCC 22028 / DSM 70294 / BCRC 21397 / CBS 2163 / NBRC 10782 / NRRL Y-8283 / UCD 57-17) TaxID=436907 RepID=A7TFD5_VANPO|nr:uncharacterized protein Kpol_2002p19 [Vanderwaltozyma polyspora DSM 70294]EDO18949.1 hypothetical protein Kpol_2002p19 [Vanderwaltozyma polyspora DSM 70294]